MGAPVRTLSSRGSQGRSLAAQSGALEAVHDDACTLLGASLVVFMLAAIVASSALLMAGVSLSPWKSRLVLSLAAILAVSVARMRASTRQIVGMAFLVAITFLAAAVLVDTSYDGQEYHYAAVYALVHGWNPYHESFGRVIAPGATVLPWPDHYPIGSWLLMAMLESAGAPTEAAKAAQMLPMIVVPFAWYPALRGLGQKTVSAIPLALLAAASPVWLAQFYTRMNDGMLASIAAAFTGFALQHLLTRSRAAILAACGCLAIGIDVKFNAIAIMGALAAAWCLIVLWRDGLRAALATGSLLLATSATVVGGIAAHPYVTNLLEHGHPFYPVIGAPELEIASALLPDGLRGHGPLGRFAVSLLAPSNGAGSKLKPPFVIGHGEVRGVETPDTFVGGFGPLFSGALILAFLTACAVLLGFRRSTASAALLLFAAAAVASALITPHSWWARYVPQLWLGVYLAAVAGVSAGRAGTRLLGYCCAATLLLNSAVVGFAALRFSVWQTREVQAQIKEALAAPGGYCANFGGAYARIALLREAGASVIPLSFDLPATCAGAREIPRAWTFGMQVAQSCPCSTVQHDPSGRWDVPPDETVEAIRKLRQSVE